MHAKDVLRSSFGRSKMVTQMLVGDLSDAEIMQRPTANANHIAWQLGHLISSLNYFGEAIKPSSMPALPPGFAEQHDKQQAQVEDPAAFLTKERYVQLLDQQRDALLQLLESLQDDDLAADAPAEVRDYAPKVVDLLGLAAEHEMMHSGQISVLRRKLGKPVAF